MRQYSGISDVSGVCVVDHVSCCCCRPLHVAVVQGQLDLVQRLVETMSQLHASVDCYNHLRQVSKEYVSTAVLTVRHCYVR